ncbi:hypothetical protein [uncultured Muribaculum sp.]|nr:hypothetical protein [uncultured Muribaculum sp.]
MNQQTGPAAAHEKRAELSEAITRLKKEKNVRIFPIVQLLLHGRL